jgi:hypothetical protein
MTTYTTHQNSATPTPLNQAARTRIVNRERAKLFTAVMAITDGTTQFEALTLSQVASLCRASMAFAHWIRVAQKAPRFQAVESQLQAAE